MKMHGPKNKMIYIVVEGDLLQRFLLFVSLSVQPVLHRLVFHGVFTGFVPI